MENLIGLAVMLCVPAYVVAQIMALIQWRGRSLWLALVPVGVMGLALALLFIGIRDGSNLAPLFIVLAAPPCLLWLCVVDRFRPA